MSPGADLIAAGLADLARGVESEAALLVSIGAPRLRARGVPVERPLPEPERRLYERLQGANSDGAHSQYNALMRQLVSFESPQVCDPLVHRGRVRRFMEILALVADKRARVYFSGGATAVLLGYRYTTRDIDIRLVPLHDVLLHALPHFKHALCLKVKLASLADFIPVPPGWERRSPLIARVGDLSFHHFDLYAQALAKIERGHAQDMADVSEMLRRGFVDPARALRYFRRIEPELYRFPVIDPPTFRRAVHATFGSG